MSCPRVLYCHCQYAQVVPVAVKQEVLRQLCASGAEFEAVPDLCEMSARKDPSLARLAEGQGVKIAACFPRAGKWLFAAAGAPLPGERCEVLDMRGATPPEVTERFFGAGLQPNLPIGKVTAPLPAELPEPVAS